MALTTWWYGNDLDARLPPRVGRAAVAGEQLEIDGGVRERAR